MVTHTYPRLLVSAPSSSTGKTTVALGIMAALTRRGLRVAPFKTGPDYIDPGFHTLAAGRVGRNLDAHLCGPELVAPLFAHGFATPEPADVAIIEGAMGLFDGQLGTDPVGRAGFGSSAHVAGLVQAPVVLVVDASSSSRTVAALAAGMANHDPAVRVAGVVLNRTSSPRNIAEITRALDEVGLPMVGALPKSDGLATPSRHLGLVPAAERDEAAALVAAAADLVAEHLDLDLLLAIASSAPELDVTPWDAREAVAPWLVDAASADDSGAAGTRPRIAVAGGRAFTFRYAETTELLEAAGCECVDFDPMVDSELPENTSGLLVGGGFPEVFAGELAHNQPMIAAVREAISAGLPTVAECAGLLYLCQSLDGVPMVGALPLVAEMGPRLTLGYHSVRSLGDTLLTRADEVVRAHEFHRTQVRPGAPLTIGAGAHFAKCARDEMVSAWQVVGANGGREEGWSADPAGLGHPSVHASYQHLHWAGSPQLAARFATAVHEWSGHPSPSHPTPRTTLTIGAAAHSAKCAGAPIVSGQATDAPDLRHHGDRDTRPGLVDLAVNVHANRPPEWLWQRLTADPSRWAGYPDAEPARRALAERHGLPPEMVLPTAGAAEAFTLVARALHHLRHPLVVHPQFTEPEQALITAGHHPEHLVLAADNGFHLPDEPPHERHQLVVIGNPTNPTGVLHPAAVLTRWRAPGRVLLVDEAFMDAIVDEPESLIGPDMDGLLVTRSLTKTWSLAGIRAGYVVGDPRLIAELERQQPHWSVGTPALDAMIACSSPEALADQRCIARQIATHREALVTSLTEAGFPPVPGSQAPFVLVDTLAAGPGSVREMMAERGFAVRRGESFPGLGPSWIRLAVREPQTSKSVADALAQLRTTP